MGVGFASIEIARSGLTVNERGLSVTSQNISNVNTAGYVRQQAVLSDAAYHLDNEFQYGLGSDIQKIRQIRHSFLDNIYRQESQSLGYWEARQKTLSEIQSLLGEPLNEGMQNSMNNFWDSWQELSKAPESLTTRALVKQRGEALVQYVNHMGAQFDKMQADLDSEIKVRVQEVNSLTQKIAELNVEILSVETSKDTANDLRDERNLAIDRLSKLVDCDVYETQDGQIDVTIGGYFLVSKGINDRVKTVENKEGSLFTAVAFEESGIIIPVGNGTIKGLMESRGEVEGTIGSFENGSPNDKIDLVFAFNTNDTATRRDELYDNIDSIVNFYTNKGIGVRLGYVTFNETGMTSPTTFETSTKDINGVYVPDVSAFKSHIGSTTLGTGISFTGSGATSVGVEALKDAQTASENANMITDWRNTSTQVILYSDGSIDNTGLGLLAQQFKEGKVRTTVISDISNKEDLGMFAEVTGDRFVENNSFTGEEIIEEVSESVRASISGNVPDTLNIIPDFKSRLNTLVNALTREVNSLHRNGVTLNGSTGEDFFVPINPFYPMQMGNIQINPKLADLNYLVSSVNGSVGDNTVATAISDLRHSSILGKTSQIQNMDDFYRAVIGEVGNRGSEADNATNGQTSLVNSADNARLSIMNVSMDEEMTNMMKYQHAYNAAARVLNVFDEMFEAIVNRLGLVGR